MAAATETRSSSTKKSKVEWEGLKAGSWDSFDLPAPQQGRWNEDLEWRDTLWRCTTEQGSQLSWAQLAPTSRSGMAKDEVMLFNCKHKTKES